MLGIGQGHSVLLEATHIPSHMVLSVFKAAIVCPVLPTLLKSLPLARENFLLVKVLPDWVRSTQIISMF